MTDQERQVALVMANQKLFLKKNPQRLSFRIYIEIDVIELLSLSLDLNHLAAIWNGGQRCAKVIDVIILLSRSKCRSSFVIDDDIVKDMATCLILLGMSRMSI